MKTRIKNKKEKEKWYLLDYNKNLVSNVNGFRINNDLDMFIFPTLSSGIYYLKITNNDNIISNVDVSFEYRNNTSEWLNVNQQIEIVDCIHNSQKKYLLSLATSGIYKIELNAISDFDITFGTGTIEIYYKDSLMKKVNISNFSNYTQSIQNANSIVFFVEQNKIYDVVINFSQIYVDQLYLNLEPVEQIAFGAYDDYNSEEALIYGDAVKRWVVKETSQYKISLDYYGNSISNHEFYILKQNGNNIMYMDSTSFSGYVHMKHREMIVNLSNDDVIYLGYFDGVSDGTIKITIERNITQSFDILVDPNSGYTVGSEVNLGFGPYGETIIHQGLTRICYLGPDAPDSRSRLNYEWISADEGIAKVSAYGTITAISPGRTKIMAIYKLDKTIVGTIYIDVIGYPGEGIIYLNYGMDVRVDGTISGTEVTSGSGSIIEVSSSPYVTIHLGNTRLICLGSDSPSSSIQDFEWSSGDTSIATVSSFGTINALEVGSVVIYGKYKYNQNYRVRIDIEVLPLTDY